MATKSPAALAGGVAALWLKLGVACRGSSLAPKQQLIFGGASGSRRDASGATFRNHTP